MTPLLKAGKKKPVTPRNDRPLSCEKSYSIGVRYFAQKGLIFPRS
jgi:hypothetical protein